jgi:large subunit ribosomal protein L22
MEVIAKAKYIRRTPRKARLIADAVRGMPVAEALAFLEFSSRHAALDVAKVIKSAAANAEHNFNLNREDLVVKALMVDEGPTMKRIRPVSRGMAHQYFHRTCHITAVVEDREEAVPVVRAPRAATPATTRTPRTRTPRSTT